MGGELISYLEGERTSPKLNDHMIKALILEAGLQPLAKDYVYFVSNLEV